MLRYRFVAGVRVGETTPHLLPSGIVVTDYQCSVRERLSGSGPEEFAVRIPGGTASGRQTVNAKVPPLEPGADYLLFLNFNQKDGIYRVSYGADSIFRLIDGRLAAHAPGTVCMRPNGIRPSTRSDNA